MKVSVVVRSSGPGSSRLASLVIAALAIFVSACGGDNDNNTVAPQPIAVLSAFPAEMAAVLARATVADTMTIDDHVFRRGTLGGVRVVIGITGIGLVNAAATTRLVLDQFAPRGVVVSAVAGSSLQIGDVTVPAAWELKDGTTFAADAKWLDLAHTVAAAVSLERCTTVSSAGAQQSVCMVDQPTVLVGGIGQSTDPFVGRPFPCQPGGGDLYGCDIPPANGAASAEALASSAAAEPDTPVANDMETAAIAREAAARGVRFIAFRAVSDGAGDPLGLPGFLAQFSAYYHFAARNAAAATVAFLERLASTPAAR